MEYISGKEYKKGSIVLFNKAYFKALEDTKAPPLVGRWLKVPKPSVRASNEEIEPVPYSLINLYKEGSKVNYNGTIYVALTPSQGAVPGISIAWREDKPSASPISLPKFLLKPATTTPTTLPETPKPEAAPVAEPKYVVQVGKPGKDGVDGKDGKDGRQGPKGERGPKGEKGDTGPAGRDGKDGKDGRDGKDGKDGEQGPVGPMGPPGKDAPAPFIEIGGGTGRLRARITAVEPRVLPAGGTTNQVLKKSSNADYDVEWATGGGGGGSTAWGDITGTLSNQTDLQTALDGKVDENAPITGATKTKITYDAKGLVTAGADATTADIADSSNKRYVTDAQLTVIGNTSGTNTGDQNLFSTIAVSGQSDVVADTTSDTLTLVAGSNVTITTDAATDTITIAASGGGGGAPTDASYVTIGTNGTLTDERVLTAGTGISITDGGAGSTVTVASTITQYTDEMAQDAVGGILVDSSEIDFTYNDGTPSITASIVSGSIDESKLDASVNASLDLADTAVQPAALASYVPYTGATANVDLGTYDLITDTITSKSSAGLILENASGGDVLHIGSGGGVNATAYGGWNFDNVTASRVAQFGASKTLESSSVTNTELGYISGLTSSAQTQLNAKIPSAEKGAANGVAPLGSDSKISTTYLPAAVLGAASYQGVWNANTNSPTIVSSTGTKGHYYVVDTAGSTNIDGITDWKLGDWIIFNGTTWEKVDNTDAVTSVNSQTGAVVLDADDIDDSATTNKFVTAGDLTNLSNLSGTNTGDQNLFSTIAVSGQSNVVADSTSDTLTLVAGSNITITTDASTDSITIAASGSGSSAFNDLTSGTNTTAAMVVGSGASLATSGSGTIAATSVPVSGVSGLGTGVATSLGVNIGAANKFPTVNAGGTSLEYTYSANQNLQTVDSPTFASLTITNDLPIASGGTAASTASGARVSLNVLRGIILPETQAIIEAMTTAPKRARTFLIDDTVDALIEAGIWTKLDALWVMAAADSQAARLNWVSPSTYGLSEINSLTFTVDVGYQGNGSSSYLDPAITPSALSQYSQDSASIGVWCMTDSAATTPEIGLLTGDSIRLITRTAGGNQQCRINNTSSFSVAQASSAGHSVANRSGASALEMYRNGSSIGTASTASAAVSSSSLYLLREASLYSARQISVAHIGSSLTSGEASDLYAILNTYLTDI